MGDSARTRMCYAASALIQNFWLDLYRVQQWTDIDDGATWEVLMKKVGGELDSPVEHFVRMRFHREGPLVDLIDYEQWLTSARTPPEYEKKVEMSVVMQHHLYKWTQGSRFIKPIAGCTVPGRVVRAAAPKTPHSARRLPPLMPAPSPANPATRR